MSLTNPESNKTKVNISRVCQNLYIERLAVKRDTVMLLLEKR